MQSLQTDLRADLGSEAFARAWEQGEVLDLDALTEQLLAEFGPGAADRIAEANQSLPDPLTPRELEVLGLLGMGLTNAQIAERLVISTGTVKWYMSMIYSKLAVEHRVQALVRAQELQLL
jgi:ATP/maltotriose-dependent transcriptional regulator MalT